MKLSVTERRPCKMRRGDLRRVPQLRGARVIGYYVACPRCGFVTPIIQGQDGVRIEEDGELVSFSAPVQCVMCLVRIALVRGEATLEEGPDVRPVRAH
jgi:hypothetical protein